jgi:GNAT superfamily N-acetyltransferase
MAAKASAKCLKMEHVFSYICSKLYKIRMPPIIIREAKKEDCARMLELVQELAVYERAPEEVTVSLEHFIESGFGPMPVWWAFVAEAEGVIVGFALYYIRYSTWKGQRMYLEDILVTEAWRGKGIGGLLMDALVKAAKEKKFTGVTWQVLNWNEPAIRFYERYKVRFDHEWVNATLEIKEG